MKKILVIYYSQSNQLKEILDSICLPLKENAQVDFYEIKMRNPYPFPWDKEAFFNVFPESFQQVPQPIEEIPEAIKSTNYDLILLGYQVWYLSPSIPINSFLKSEQAQILLANKPIITVSGSRNMWVMAHEKIKKLFVDCKVNLVGNIALVDRHLNHISVITIVQWMFTGKKEKYLGIFPKPGVSNKDIQESTKFGQIINHFLVDLNGNFKNLQKEIVANNGVEIKPFLVEMDQKANKMFKVWSKITINAKNRKFRLKLFNYYLLVAIWLIAPIVFILHLALYPFKYFGYQKSKKYYQGL